ncbi:hypothetical protein FA13DRAFT_1802413 [Coprinellus micaceus]|uniref:Uncharacterized protein n=1 Tax=Coprinellus micaceus TaxID=71717 RepID=A0A4Y7SC98_COPMI|nr:hypothetical protein FA13DRAFT_1802413 [Coprinellus micaceus]
MSSIEPTGVVAATCGARTRSSRPARTDQAQGSAELPQAPPAKTTKRGSKKKTANSTSSQPDTIEATVAPATKPARKPRGGKAINSKSSPPTPTGTVNENDVQLGGAGGPGKTKREESKRQKEELKKKADEMWEELEQRDQQAVRRQEEAPLILPVVPVNTTTSDAPRVPTRQAEDDYEEIDVSNISPCTSDEGDLVEWTPLGAPERDEEAGPLTDGSDKDDDEEWRLISLQAEIQAIQAMRAKKNKGKAAKALKPGPPSSTLPLASGLRKEFRHDEDVALEKIPAGTVTFGGLQDDDIADTAPPGNTTMYNSSQASVQPLTGGLQRDTTRQNSNVGMLAPPPNSIVPPANPFSIPVPAQANATTPAGSQANTLPKPAQRRTKAPVQKVCIPEAGSITKSGSKGKKTTKHAKVGELPDFAISGREWATTFLPSLTHTLYTSTDPFNDFRAGSTAFRDNCQHLIQEVFPQVDYTVAERKDVVVSISYARINERRGRIAKDVLLLIQDYVKTTFPNHVEAEAWLDWARHPFGPLFFENPVPAAYCHPQGNRSTQIPQPTGCLHSHFIISLLETSLKRIEGSAIDNRDLVPIGLTALILTALEHAAIHVLPSGTVKPSIPDFSYDEAGSMCNEWVKTLRAIPWQKWQELTELCAARLQTPPRVINHSLLAQQRATLFNFDSPVKGA